MLAIGVCPSAPPPHTRAPFMQRRTPQISAPSRSASSATKPERPSQPPPSPALHFVEAVLIHPQDRLDAGFGRQSSRSLGWPRGNTLAQSRLALSAHLSRPRQRQPHRPDGKARCHASHLPALSRRQLPRRRSHLTSVSTGRRPSARWSTGPRTPAPGATTPPTASVCSSFSSGAKTSRCSRARRLRRLLLDAGARAPRPRSRTLRAGRARRDRIRHRRNRHQVGRRPRAKTAIPRPFKLTYVEIGNEDSFDESGTYDGRYAQFYKAIKAKYPDLQLIATMPLKNMKPDVSTITTTSAPTQSFQRRNHYDKTDRNGPKIFVGEWATREGAPTPNFDAALGDAAWMTGMERNSDLDRDGRLCAVARQRQSRRHAMGDGSHRLRHDEQLRLTRVTTRRSCSQRISATILLRLRSRTDHQNSSIPSPRTRPRSGCI